MTSAKLLRSLHNQLGWPSPEDIFSPRGAGPSVYARLANQKLADPIRHLENAQRVRAGVLMGNPAADQSDDPIGVVCEFDSPISDLILRETHKLAWSFSRSKLLVTVEPHLVRIWSCYERPNFDDEPFSLTTVTDPVTELDLSSDSCLDLDRAAELIHWAQIASGQLVAKNPTRFNDSERANKMLLANLRFIRRKLKKSLPEPVTHDLLARLIFIQFLFQRKGSRGKPALHAGLLRDLCKQGVISRPHSNLSDILRDKDDTYSFFEWLDEKFNGDLFPDDWSEERDRVTSDHLLTLSDFVSGEIEVENGQRCLWPLYSFDAIPLEFISSIYEEFVAGGDDDGASVGEHYTRTELVDLVLDKVLPWKGRSYDLKILDPACGSGIFLVKAFQRLVFRWRTANRGKEPSASFLAGLLENNIFGVDINEQAVRVASFSLYLAMCDEKDPRHYWTTMRFPSLRGLTLCPKDFFDETVLGIRTIDDAGWYDIVVGNAPWGDSSLTPDARAWAKEFLWETADEQSGVLFLPKAMKLTSPRGRVCMIQSANSLLFNIGSTAVAVRKKLFESYKVHEIINLSMRRFEIFPEAVAPACVISLSQAEPDADPIAYWSPKTTLTLDAQNYMAMEAHDLNWVYPREAARDARVWTTLALGGRRDLEFIRRLCADTTLLKDAEGWRVDRGFQRGVKIPFLDRLQGVRLKTQRIRRKDPIVKAGQLLCEALEEHSDCMYVMLVCYSEHAEALQSTSMGQRRRIVKVAHFGEKTSVDLPEQSLPFVDLVVVLGPLEVYEDRVGLPALEGSEVEWDDSSAVMAASSLRPNSSAIFEHPRELESYALPVALVAESWTIDRFRFRSVVVQPDAQQGFALYSQSFYGIHAPSDKELASFVAAMTSSLLVYYLYMTGGRLVAYRPTVRKAEIEGLPLPTHSELSLAELALMSSSQIDTRVFSMYGLNVVERALVEDFFKYTLSDFKQGAASAGREPVRHEDGDMTNYCDFFLRVLRSGFGEGKRPGAVIYRTANAGVDLGFSVVAIYLDSTGLDSCAEKWVTPSKLMRLLVDVDRLARGQVGGSVFYQRVARVYTSAVVDSSGHGLAVPTVFLIKPSQRRYWTKAAALRDADDVAVDIMAWMQNTRKNNKQ